MRDAIKFAAKDGVGQLTVYCSQSEDRRLQLLIYSDTPKSEEVFKHLEAALKEHNAIAHCSTSEPVNSGRMLTLTFTFFPELERCLASNGFRLDPL